MKQLFGLWAVCILACIPTYAQVVPNQHHFGSNGIFRTEMEYEEGLIRKAEKELLETIDKFKENPSADKSVLVKAGIDLRSGNFNVAAGQLSDFIKSRPNSPFVPHAALQRGYIFFEQRKYQQAEHCFEQAKIFAEEDYPIRQQQAYRTIAHRALFWRGVSLSQYGRYQDAVPVFEECAKKYPEGRFADDALYALGKNSEINKYFAEAVAYYNKIEKIYPYSNCLIASNIRKANNKLILRQFPSALLILEKTEDIQNHIIKADSIGLLYEEQTFSENAHEKILYLRGESYNLSGNYDKASDVFDAFMETFYGSDIEFYVVLGAGWAKLNENKYDEALKFYDKIILEAEDGDERIKAIAQLYRVVALNRSGNRKQAQKELAALSVQPTYPFLGQVMLELGQIYYESKKFDYAKRTLERAARETYDAIVLVRIHLLLGASCIEMGMWTKAVDSYKKAERLADRSEEIFMPQKKWYIAESRLKQGIALVKSHKSAKAINVLLAFAAGSPDDTRMDEALFWLAEAYYRTDLLNNSADAYKSIIDSYPKSQRREEAIYGLGWSYFRQKKFGKSSTVFGQMITEFPKSKFSIEVLTRQGDAYYYFKNYAKAADSYHKASKYNKRNDEVQYSAYQYAHSLYMQQKFEPAISALLYFVRNYTGSEFSPYALYLIGWIKFQQGKYNEAIQDFTFLTEAYSQSSLMPRTFYAISDSYYNMGKYEEAIEAYKYVKNTYPTTAYAPDALKSIQDCLIILDREDEAVDVLGEYIDTNPDSPYAENLRYKKADMFYTGRNYNDALAEYDKFLEKYPESEKTPEVLYNKGKSLIKMNKVDEAILIFDSIAVKHPQSEYTPQAMLETGKVWESRTEIGKADSVYLAIQLAYPENEIAANAGFERAEIKFSLGDTLASMDIYRGIAESFPYAEYGGQSRYRVAKYYKSKGWNDSARTEFAKLAAREDDIMLAAEAQYRIGELYIRDKEYEKAKDALLVLQEKFAGVEDFYSYGMLALGDCYDKLEMYEEASQVYKVLKDIRGKDDIGKQAATRLKWIKKKMKN